MNYREFSEYGEVVKGSIRDIIETRHQPDEKSVVVLTRNFYQLAAGLPSGVSRLYWEDIMRYYERNNFLSKFADIDDGMEELKFSMLQSLERLDRYLAEVEKVQPDKVYFIPFGMEDEGVVLADWLSRKKEGTKFTAVLYRPLDCCDLLKAF